MKNIDELKNKCTKYIVHDFFVFREDGYEIFLKQDICKKYFLDIPVIINDMLLKINSENSDVLSIHDILLDDKTEKKIVEVNKPIENISVKYWCRNNKILGIFICANVPNLGHKGEIPVKELEIEIFATDDEEECFI
ncbi:hypothetical protein A9K75_06535 [Campylobacter fetus subsp. testudinum]|uniref:hypothetical protein n=1 Tax=Campylobacter fetus TaxID=196 RepID=UPI000818B525|nr:hypothetical protein [Campylobacter fetus]OCR99522.1 hypothetical protein A9K75_06535 [Campylobacter fetus subsp. testudinum]